MKLEFYPETCCDECGRVVHNHFDCPVCGAKNAGTGVYDDYVSIVALEEGLETFHFECEVCNTSFRVVSAPDDFDEWEWESLPNSEK